MPLSPDDLVTFLPANATSRDGGVAIGASATASPLPELANDPILTSWVPLVDSWVAQEERQRATRIAPRIVSSVASAWRIIRPLRYLLAALVAWLAIYLLVGHA